MAGKVKMKCARCGKHFKSSHQKQTLCQACEILERQARAANKVTVAKPAQTAPVSTPPKIVGPGASILVPGLVPPAAASAADVPAEATTTPHTGDPQHSAHEPGRASRQAHGQGTKPVKAAKGTRPDKPARAAQPVREPRAPRPQTPPFQLTDELRARIEAHYLELAQPVEFDGIRSQIAADLSIPKHAVKRAVQELRARLQLPSWWELQSYTGSDADLARIRAAYEPLLPIPAVGIHKQIAVDLGLDPILVYRGIRRIRAEMRLPQYNPPEAHSTPDAPAQAASTVSATAP